MVAWVASSQKAPSAIRCIKTHPHSSEGQYQAASESTERHKVH